MVKVTLIGYNGNSNLITMNPERPPRRLDEIPAAMVAQLLEEAQRITPEARRRLRGAIPLAGGELPGSYGDLLSDNPIPGPLNIHPKK